MYAQPQQQPSVLKMIVICSFFGWTAWKSLNLQALPVIPYILGFVALAVGFRAVGLALWRFNNVLQRRDAMLATELRGSATWATQKDLMREGLYETCGVFLGCDTEGRPIFFEGQSHGLTLAPSGAGKTVAFVVPAIAHSHSSLSLIVSDFKGTLAVMTKSLRKQHKDQEVFCVNPAHLYINHLGTPARYNPVQILIDDWMDTDKNKDLIADAQSIALQLCPEPAATGENTFFRNGSRKILVFILVFLVTFHGTKKATLSEALSVLRNVKLLIEA